MRYLFIVIGLFFIVNTSFSQVNPKLSEEIKSVKDTNLIRLVFEDHFLNDTLIIKNKNSGIIGKLILNTDDRLGLADKIWINKSEFPVRIQFKGKITFLKNKRYKYIYLGKRDVNKLRIQYSNNRRIYR
jgi:hypothetical protein